MYVITSCMVCAPHAGLQAAGKHKTRSYFPGAGGEFVKEYLDATVPELAFGEYWDTCEYTDGVLNYNQDAHRQRTVNWCDRTGGTSAAFDFTTKGVQLLTPCAYHTTLHRVLLHANASSWAAS